MLSKFNRVQFIIFGGIIFLVLVSILILIGILPGLKQTATRGAKLEIWGFESELVWKDFILRNSSPDSGNVTYKEIDENQYESMLVNAIAEGTGPDIFMLKDSQLLKHKNKIAPFKNLGQGENPLSMSNQEFKNTFVDAAQAGLLSPQGGILGLPLFLDSLALFYNKDFFNSANIPAPPKSWDEFVDFTEKLTKTSPIGDVESSGAALGEAINIEHFVDIVSALIFQAGGSIIDYERNESVIYKGVPKKQEDGTTETIIPVESALSFYTSFANTQKKNYSWNKNKPNSIDAFAREETAMIIGFARDLPVIIAKNPHLNFGVAEFPQPTGAEFKINYGRYNFLTVSRLSPNKDAAWAYLIHITSRNPNIDYLKRVGLPPVRRDLINPAPETDERLIPFYNQSLSVKSWLQPDETGVSAIFKDMVELLVSKKLPAYGISTQANDRLNQLLKK